MLPADILWLFFENILKLRVVNFILCVWVFSLYECLCTMWVPGALRSEEGVICPELIVSYHIGDKH